MYRRHSQEVARTSRRWLDRLTWPMARLPGPRQASWHAKALAGPPPGLAGPLDARQNGSEARADLIAGRRARDSDDGFPGDPERWAPATTTATSGPGTTRTCRGRYCQPISTAMTATQRTMLPLTKRPSSCSRSFRENAL